MQNDIKLTKEEKIKVATLESLIAELEPHIAKDDSTSWGMELAKAIAKGQISAIHSAARFRAE